MSELIYQKWYGECVNNAKNQDKFYHLIAISKDDGHTYKAVAVSGRNGLPGIAQPMKNFRNALELSRFIKRKLQDGYETKVSNTPKEMSGQDARAELEMMFAGVTKMQSLKGDWITQMIGAEEGIPAQQVPPTKTEKPTNKVDNHDVYGDRWGAWG